MSSREAPPKRSFTENQFADEMLVAGFLGAYAFWRKVLDQDDEHLRRHGEALLQALGQLAFAALGGVPRSPQEAEAFRYCGLFEPSRPT